MFRFLLLVLCVPTLTMGWAAEDIYDEAVSALSKDLANSTAHLAPFNYDWVQRLYLIFKTNCYLHCLEGEAGPFKGLQRPGNNGVLQSGNVLDSSVTVDDFRYNYSRCALQLAFWGSEHYSGLSKGNNFNLSFSVEDSSTGCVARVRALEVGLSQGISFDEDNWGVKMAEEFRDLGLVTKLIGDHIVEGVNSHFQSFVNRTYTLPHQCPS